MSDDSSTKISNRRFFRQAMADVRPLKSTNNLFSTLKDISSSLRNLDHVPLPTESLDELFADVRQLKVRIPTHWTQLKKKKSHLLTREFPPIELLDLSQNEFATYKNNSYIRQGYSERILRKIKRDRYPINAEIDLHGYVQKEAQKLLCLFVTDSLNRNYRCIRIIHGKGFGSYQNLPVLKKQVRYWLTQFPEVIAYTSANLKDGGEGATVALLKIAS